MHVIFLHGGTASKDETERDDAFDESRERKKREPEGGSGEEKQEFVTA